MPDRSGLSAVLRELDQRGSVRAGPSNSLENRHCVIEAAAVDQNQFEAGLLVQCVDEAVRLEARSLVVAGDDDRR